jgi:short-subunit dehydrogenase
MDVVNETSVANGVAEVAAWTQQHRKPFVALVNNAGISYSMPVELFPMERVRSVMEVNYFGVVRITQLCAPLLRQHKGRIVTIGSVAGHVSLPGHGIYSSSKFAIEALSDALRVELAGHKVSVSLVDPAYVQTAIGAKGLGDESPFRQATEEQREIYPYFFSSFEAKRTGAFHNAAFPNTTTTPAIVDAITSTTPSPRYLVAGVGSLPAWLVVSIARNLPTPLRDLYFARGFYGPASD